MTARKFWLLLSLVLVFAAALFASQFLVTDSYYLRAASTVVPETPSRQSTRTSTPSQQPKPFGFSENEMHKSKAEGYSVY